MPDPTTTRRNVLLITADQWRAEAVGAAGHPVVRTPHLDRLAKDGTRFARHYTQASPCGPARACLLTGRYLMNHRVVRNGTPLDARHTNLALEIRRDGYDPTLFGYTDTTVDPRTVAAGDPRLFTYEGVLPGLTPALVVPEDPRPWLAWLKAQGFGNGRDLTHETIYRPMADHPDASGRGATWAPATYPAELSDTAFVVGEALKWLAVQADRPWFLHLSLLRPHPPWVAPAPYHALYDAADMPAPIRRATLEEESAQHPLLAYLHGRLPAEAFFPDRSTRPALASDRDVAQARATYAGLVTEVDHHLGRLFDHLRVTGAYDDTLILVTSDHGENLGDHFLFGKTGCFDQAFHIPLIVRDPRAEADPGRGIAVERFTETVDIMPTVLDWLGLMVPPQCDGQSLLPFCTGRMPSHWRDHVHWEFDFRDVRTLEAETVLGLKPDQCSLSVIRGERYKYVHFTALPPLFFNLAEDPYEFDNRAADRTLRAEVLAHAQAMLSWRMNHADRDLANLQAGPDGMAEWRGPRR